MPLEYIILVEIKKEHTCNRKEEVAPRLRARGGAVEGTRPEPPTFLWFIAPRDRTASGKTWVRGLSNRGKVQSPPCRGTMGRGY